MTAQEGAVEEAERQVVLSLAVMEWQTTAMTSREENLRARGAATTEFLSGIQAREGDVAHQEEQVSFWEVDVAAHEESLAGREQVSAASVDKIRGWWRCDCPGPGGGTG